MYTSAESNTTEKSMASIAANLHDALHLPPNAPPPSAFLTLQCCWEEYCDDELGEERLTRDWWAMAAPAGWCGWCAREWCGWAWAWAWWWCRLMEAAAPAEPRPAAAADLLRRTPPLEEEEVVAAS